MYELVKVTDRTYYVQSPAKIGLYRLSDTDVCLIDSGGDKDAGRKVRQLLDANGWRLTAIYNTHSNADHIGGNQYLHRQTGCKIYAPGVEGAFTRSPILEPSFLYGGYPCAELRHKFLLAQESPAQEPELPDGFEMIPLPGHFFEMVGYRTPDDVLFLADCLSGPETLDKYKITFLYDVRAYLDTLRRVETMTAKAFVPAHAPATDDIAPLARKNIETVCQVADKIVELCAQPIGFEALLQRLFDDYGLTMTFEQYALVGSTVRSYLSYLKDDGRLSARIEGNRLLWQKS